MNVTSTTFFLYPVSPPAPYYIRIRFDVVNMTYMADMNNKTSAWFLRTQREFCEDVSHA